MPNVSRFAVLSARSLGLNAAVSSENWVTGFTVSGAQLRPTSVFSTNSEYYVGGWANPSVGGDYPWVLKTNLNGAIDPSFRITLPLAVNPSNYNVTVQDVAVDTAGDLMYVLLNGTLISTGAVSIWLVKYNLATSSVSLAKQSNLSATTTSSGLKLQLSSDKSALYVLTSNGTNQFVSKVATSTFSVTWSRFMSGTPILFDMVVDSSDNVYVAGSQTVSSATTGLIVSWDSSGTLRWRKIDDPGSTVFFISFTRISLSSDESRVWARGTKNDSFGTGSLQVAHSASTGAYDFAFTAFTRLDNTLSPNYLIAPSFTSSTGITRVYLNTSGSPDGISVYDSGFNYKLQFTSGGNIDAVPLTIGINTLRQRYVVPFSASSTGYVTALLGSGDIANGTYGTFTIANPGTTTTDSASFNTFDSTLTSTAATITFATNVSLTPGTLALASETTTPLP